MTGLTPTLTTLRLSHLEPDGGELQRLCVEQLQQPSWFSSVALRGDDSRSRGSNTQVKFATIIYSPGIIITFQFSLVYDYTGGAHKTGWTPHLHCPRCGKELTWQGEPECDDFPDELVTRYRVVKSKHYSFESALGEDAESEEGENEDSEALSKMLEGLFLPFCNSRLESSLLAQELIAFLTALSQYNHPKDED